VSVHPEHSGKGIGRRLTEKCIEMAKSNHEKMIALHTSEMMNKARHIYESLGFTILRELEPRLGKKYWLYTLSLDSSS
jgi:ribosomal protein S18 acetylase RimI-like enzyme